MESLEETRANLLMSAECNLNCKYCYISKNNSLSGIDDKILDEWENRGILNKLKDNYSKNLKSIGLWGSEPTLYLQYFVDELPRILDYFSDLDDIMISSNFYAKSSMDKLFDMIKVINENTNRVFNLDVQTSLDGPPNITNKSRPPKSGKGKTVDHIKENLDYLLRKVENYDLRDNFTVKNKFKSTVPMNYIREMGEDKDKLREYIEFFDQEMWGVYERYMDDLPETFKWSVTSGAPTMVVPGDYTVEDGKAFKKYIHNVKDLAIENHDRRVASHFTIYAALPDLHELNKVARVGKPHREQNRAFACSAGGKGTSVSINNESHVCHRDFLLGQQAYIDIMEKEKDEYEMGRLKQYRDNMIVDDKNNNNHEYLRQRYVIQGWRDFAQLRFNYNYANLKFMAKIGQAHGNYLQDDDLAKLLSKFLLRSQLCTVENIENTGSYFIKPMRETKLWANGAFQELIDARNELVEGGIING